MKKLSLKKAREYNQAARRAACTEKLRNLLAENGAILFVCSMNGGWLKPVIINEDPENGHTVYVGYLITIILDLDMEVERWVRFDGPVVDLVSRLSGELYGIPSQIKWRQI